MTRTPEASGGDGVNGPPVYAAFHACGGLFAAVVDSYLADHRKVVAREVAGWLQLGFSVERRGDVAALAWCLCFSPMQESFWPAEGVSGGAGA